MTRRAAIIVLDGVGIGEAPDAAAYGDVGSNTLGNVAAGRWMGMRPSESGARRARATLRRSPASTPAASPDGAWGLMVPRSAGKDSTAGHWEIAGVHLAEPVSDIPAWISAGRRRRIRATDGASGDRERRRERDRHHRSILARSTSEPVRGFCIHPLIRYFRSPRTKT